MSFLTKSVGTLPVKALLTWSKSNIRITAILKEEAVTDSSPVELFCEDAQEGRASLCARHIVLQGTCYDEVYVFWMLVNKF